AASFVIVAGLLGCSILISILVSRREKKCLDLTEPPGGTDALPGEFCWEESGYPESSSKETPDADPSPGGLKLHQPPSEVEKK
ncbi:MAG TPA: hypothetical protein PLQ00_11310, partial [Thermoguttaceae bacterium]|nr:hypothetical protein [Thermoguttaceae bacterium]